MKESGLWKSHGVSGWTWPPLDLRKAHLTRPWILGRLWTLLASLVDPRGASSSEARGSIVRTGRSVFDLSVSTFPPATFEGPGPPA